MIINNKETAKEVLLKLSNGEKVYLNWHEDSGALVYKLEYEWFVLFEIAQADLHSRYTNTYHAKAVDKLIEEAFSWT